MPTIRSVPKYRALPTRLPPAKLPIFRSVVSHPPPQFAVAAAEAANLGPDGKKRADSGNVKPPSGAHQLFFSTAPRPLIPLTTSPSNHKLWNPPAPDSKGGRAVEKDESGRLAKFANRFAFTGDASSSSSAEDKNEGAGQFAVESDLSFLEGATVQSSGKALGKRDIVGAVKSAKKGKK